MDEILRILNTNFLGVQLWIWLVALVGLVILILIIIAIIKFKNRGVVVVEDVKIKGGQRYTKYSNVETKTGSTNITHLEGDFILQRGKVYVAKKGGELLPGKYSILANEESIKKFNIRLGGFVREFNHNVDIVIGDGEEICSVSHTTILR